MTIKVGLFYVGPVGALTPFPSVARDSNPDASPVRVGARHKSLDGTITDDILSVKRTWVLSWEDLTESQWTVINAAFLRLYDAPYRMIDSRRVNHLPPNVAATGGFYRSSKGFSTNGAGVISRIVVTPPTELAGILNSAIKLNSHAVNDYLWATAETVPLLQGSTYRLSAWLKGSGNARLAVNLSTSGVSTGSTVALHATNWARTSMTFAPGASDTTATVGVQGLTAASEVHVTGLQLEIDTSTLQPWATGAGCPEVVVIESPHSYPYLGASAKGATIQEV